MVRLCAEVISLSFYQLIVRDIQKNRLSPEYVRSNKSTPLPFEKRTCNLPKLACELDHNKVELASLSQFRLLASTLSSFGVALAVAFASEIHRNLSIGYPYAGINDYLRIGYPHLNEVIVTLGLDIPHFFHFKPPTIGCLIETLGASITWVLSS